jgi:hypothetical protein
MKRLIAPLAALCAALLPPGAHAQPPRVGPECVEPFLSPDGYVLTPQCPPKALLALVDEDPLNLRPSLDPDAPRELDGDAPRRDPLRIYERRVPGTEIYIAPSPLRNQFVYNPGQQLPLGPREQANELLFGVRVPF